MKQLNDIGVTAVRVGGDTSYSAGNFRFGIIIFVIVNVISDIYL